MQDDAVRIGSINQVYLLKVDIKIITGLTHEKIN